MKIDESEKIDPSEVAYGVPVYHVVDQVTSTINYSTQHGAPVYHADQVVGTVDYSTQHGLAPCPKCSTPCKISNHGFSITCLPCNITAIKDKSNDQFNVIAEGLSGLTVNRKGTIKYNRGKLKVNGSGTIRVNASNDVHIKGGFDIFVKGFNNVYVENGGKNIYVKMCNDVKVDVHGNFKAHRCNNVHVVSVGGDNAGDVCIVRCHDVRVEGGRRVEAHRCGDVAVEGSVGGKGINRCRNVEVSKGRGDVSVKMCRAAVVECDGNFSIKRCDYARINGVAY